MLKDATPVAPQNPRVAVSSSAFAEALESIDWTFADRKRADAIDSLHPYPAKFISEIPGTLLDAIAPKKDTIVLDPFCGSGTTLVAAQKRGLASVGVDLNPIACLISRVKTGPSLPGLLDDAESVIAEAQIEKSAVIPEIPNLDHWFKKEVQIAAAGLVTAISRRAGEPNFDALRLALSTILVRVSNQESDTRYAAIEKRELNKDAVYKAFLQACSKLTNALTSRTWSLPRSLVLEKDVLTTTPSEIGGRVGVVITSPPYPNAYEYWLYHKYRMWWLGFDPIAVKAAEIGARAHFFRRNGHTADNFVHQMRGVFELISSVLEPGGIVCFVVGRSKIHGEIVDNGDTIRAAGADVGFMLETRIERTISAKRKSFNLSHANIKTESIVVLRKS